MQAICGTHVAYWILKHIGNDIKAASYGQTETQASKGSQVIMDQSVNVNTKRGEPAVTACDETFLFH